MFCLMKCFIFRRVKNNFSAAESSPCCCVKQSSWSQFIIFLYLFPRSAFSSQIIIWPWVSVRRLKLINKPLQCVSIFGQLQAITWSFPAFITQNKRTDSLHWLLAGVCFVLHVVALGQIFWGVWCSMWCAALLSRHQPDNCQLIQRHWSHPSQHEPLQPPPHPHPFLSHKPVTPHRHKTGVTFSFVAVLYVFCLSCVI